MREECPLFLIFWFREIFIEEPIFCGIFTVDRSVVVLE
jgi:hypothetical protein